MRQFGGVEDDFLDGFVHVHGDLDAAGEGRGGQVGFEAEVVAGGDDGARQAVGVHWKGLSYG